MAQQVTFDTTPEQEASKLQFLRRQFLGAPPKISRDDVNLSGKTAIVTGANSGIGLECARQLLDLGIGKLIIAVRNEAKGEAAREALTAAKPLENGQTVEVWKLDYISYESIITFVQRVEGLKPQLNIAILNAGVDRGCFNIIPTTGYEEDLQTNYLSSVLLMLLLIRYFKKVQSDPGRIVLVSSDTASWARFDERKKDPLLKAFNEEASWDQFDRYATTKLLGQLFIAELAKHVSPSLATVSCVNPCLCHGSNISRDLSFVVTIITRVFGRTSAAGALAVIDAAVKQNERSHGQYVEDGEIRPMAPFVYSKEAEEVTQRLWKETLEALSVAGVQDIIQSLAQS
ncbi:putative short-chain dehydrogenase/reductase family protein [Annulohypoxylon stygium]|nr:putative short-chain dehydrogenase/reductase family protein [Annulohypoxylon stygium]